jgi:hypothetical protein
MKIILDFLNSNSGAIQAVSTAILVIITFIYMWLTKNLLRFQKESEEYKLQQEIIDGALKFIFRMENEIHTFYLMRYDYLKGTTSFPSEETPREELILKIEKQILDKQLMQELKYITFQVKRLKNKDLWKDLDKIGDIHEEMIEALRKADDIDEYYKIDKKYKKQREDFINKCLDISKVG